MKFLWRKRTSVWSANAGN